MKPVDQDSYSLDDSLWTQLSRFLQPCYRFKMDDNLENLTEHQLVYVLAEQLKNQLKKCNQSNE